MVATTRNSQDGDASGTLPAPSHDPPKQLTSSGRLIIFLIFPFCVGTFGLFSAYLRQSTDPDHKMKIERDFALPFTMALILIAIIGFQTSGYTTKPQSLVKWPKVRKEKKIRHVHLVKGQDPKEVVAAEDKAGVKNLTVDKKKD
jgi:hypothetical protein